MRLKRQRGIVIATSLIRSFASSSKAPVSSLVENHGTDAYQHRMRDETAGGDVPDVEAESNERAQVLAGDD
jgi:hypothetical protein